MAEKVIMPKLGMAMKEGMVGKWVAEDGATVAVDDIVAIIVTKKITYEHKTSVAGILRHKVREQETRQIGAVIGYILAPGEAMPEDDGGLTPVGVTAPAPKKKAETAAPTAAPATPAAPAPGGFVVASPAARRVARDAGIDLAWVKTAAPGGRVSEEDVKNYLVALEKVAITSSARKLAEKYKLDITCLEGSGPGGRITEEDVARFVAPPAPAASAAAPASEAPAASTFPFADMRAAIAENMVSSLQTMAQVTATTEVDVTELVELRERLKKDFSLTYTDLIVKATAIALLRHPRVNATLDGDVIRMPAEVHIGVGVALEEGLIVPVIRNVEKLSVQQIGERLRALAAKARDNSLDVDEISGGTFTITNLGNFGIDVFTPVINPPEAAILGVGRIIEKVVVYRGEIARRSMMVLSLTFDHRIVDGAPAAAFLQTLADILSHPYFIGTGS